MAKFLIIFALFIGVLSQSPIPISPETEALFNGFMNGSQLWDAIPDFRGCGGNTTFIIDSLSRASAYFNRIPFTTEDAVGGVREIGIAVEAIGIVISKCTTVPSKLSNVFNYINNLLSNSTYAIQEMGTNIFKNVYTIFTDFRDFSEIYNQGNFYECGRRLGEVARLIFSIDFPQIKKFLN
jgi:hypothetical protein